MHDVSKQEWMILEALWEKSPLFLSDIMRMLEGKLDWTHSTYLSYIRKMLQREYIGFKLVRGSRAYYPVAMQAECVEYQGKLLTHMMSPKSARMLIADMIHRTDFDAHVKNELLELAGNIDGQLLKTAAEPYQTSNDI